MMDHTSDKELREQLWRRPLAPAEEARLQSWLTAHPDGQSDWDSEKLLSAGLKQLPQPLVPSNFTSRVLQAIEREPRAVDHRTRLNWRIWTRRWLPKAAVAAVVLSAGLVSYHQITEFQRRTEVIRSMRAVSDVKVVPSPEVLKNFDDILAMDRSIAPDEDLLKALQ